ncbi:MAG: GMC family oxidoreductase [Ardenticatenaceae bacterium]
MSDSFDFLIVGGGTAGSVLAYRLSEMEDVSVLIVEAGKAVFDDNLTSASESAQRWNEVLLTEMDWAYMSEPVEGLGGTRVYSASGQGLGGTSNIYHMMHMRGRAADYDTWAYNGCAGWAWKDVRPYFQKLENQEDDTNPTAGKGGPINIVNAKDTGNPVSQTFIDACIELGYPYVDDLNANDFGVGWQHVNLKDGKRCGVKVGYLEPTLERSNVHVVSQAMVSKLLFEGQRCVGVEYVQHGETKTVRAKQEVIVCAGAIQSPKLLMLSGIGNPEHLKNFDIPVQVELPGVGENFHDHPLVIGPFGYMNQPGEEPRGQVTEVSLFWGSEEGMLVPDLQICLVHRAPFGNDFFGNVIKRVQTGEPVAPTKALVDPKVILALPGLVRPYSRGWVRLASANPTDYPRINANYFAEEADLERMTTMVQMARDIYATKAFADGYELVEIGPGAEVKTREQLREWVKGNLGSYYHFAGSCKMGIDNMSVVDTRLRVHGTEGLRVVDASIMPAITSGNPHATVVMIAERAADFIKEEMS